MANWENMIRGPDQLPWTWLLCDLERFWSSLDSSVHCWVGALKSLGAGVSVHVCLHVLPWTGVSIALGVWTRGGHSSFELSGWKDWQSVEGRAVLISTPRGPAQAGRCPGQGLGFFICNSSLRRRSCCPQPVSEEQT